MSTMDYINYGELQDVQHAARNQETLNDLQGRAESIQKRTGAQPDNWYEFKKSHPVEKKTNPFGGVIGAIAGALLGVGLTAFAAPLMGGAAALIMTVAGVGGLLAGAVIGYNYDSPNSQRERQIKDYEKYLDSVEAHVSRGRAPERQHETTISYREDHAARLQERAAVQPSQYLG